ncbi:transketolase subunit B [Bryocella elongata]|uniref:Transketolase subunit B n=1 Tax=Bryocella elongata TaxID=863522 RepID=A0A1H6AY25_9BACT|nr:transketolase C-terminal domain-containing protein [Bryocella elongata]SEG53180.1 transketolase subunit B [Bryocella elongata]
MVTPPEIAAEESQPSAPTYTLGPKADCRDAFSQTLVELAGSDPRVCAVVNDSVSSTKLKGFMGKYPERFVNVGIAEQNMVGVGTGLANGGMLPFVCGASCFLTARAMEQVKVDLGYTRSNVKLCGMSSGMAYGQLGPTHHSIEDIAWTRVIPNLTVIVPADAAETEAAMRFAHATDGPMFLRISRVPVPSILPKGHVFEPGKAVLLREGHDVTLMANGVLVSRALEAANALAAMGIEARVLNMSSIKPFDEPAVLAAARGTRGIVTAEEGLRAGGLGGIVAEILATKARNAPPLRILGLPDVFAPTGTAEFLLEHFGLTAKGIVDASVELVGSKLPAR